MPSAKEIAKLLREKGGFELSLHGGGRQDLNDYKEPGSDAYVRAMKGLKGYRGLGCDMPMQKLVHTYSRELPNARGTAGFYKWPFVLVLYGNLRKLEEEEVKRPPIKRIVRRPWIAGFFGKTHEISEEQESEVRQYFRNMRLNEITDCNSENPAWFAMLPINNDVPDGGGRRGGLPLLTLVSEKGPIHSALDFIYGNPGQYYDLAREVVPRSEFPNANAHIIDKAEPTNEILFANASEMRETAERAGYLYNFEDYVRLYNSAASIRVRVK
ncbi:MAG: hypothetical protein HY513_04815 [Candidatus Aenigmarchaeota archaeon]|nr:hypothetical protein [Candidatus Aenigmarchaeota archaeon]